jgi:hypothetical protein
MGPDYHGYSKGNRQAMVRFFSAAAGGQAAETEPELTIEKDETLECATDGQVVLMGSRTVASFTSQRSKELARARQPVSGDQLRRSISQVLKLPSERGKVDYRILRHVGNRKYPAKSYCAYAVETEPGIQALVTRLSSEQLTSRPPRSRGRALLYIAHHSADAELRSEPLVAQLLKDEPDAAFYACDVRGIGESQPDVCGADQFLKPYGSDYFHAAHGLMLDRPYLGQKTYDVIRVVQWLREQGHDEVHLVGCGWGALPATFAGVLCDEVRQVTLKHCLASFAEVAETEDYRWPYAIMLPGVLKLFDLPDCKAALKDKKLQDLEPWGAKDGMN